MLKDNIFKKLDNNAVELILLDSVSSTNEYLKSLAKGGAKANTVVVAKTQTAGKGTKNRSFISEEGGVYLSLLLNTDLKGFSATAITPMTAVAVSRAIDKISGFSTQIKWVNDVYLGSKKVSGILCESITNPNGEMPFIIVGIGVNLFKPKNDFDDSIKEIATSVFDIEHNGIYEEFIVILLNTFFDYFKNISTKSFLSEYKQKNLVLGKKIDLITATDSQSVTAVAIDDECRLVVELPDKTKKTISSGEVKIIL